MLFLVRIEGLPRTFWKRDLICDSDKSSNRFWSSNFILRLLKSESDFAFPIRTPSDFGLCQIMHLKRIPNLRGPSRFFLFGPSWIRRTKFFPSFLKVRVRGKFFFELFYRVQFVQISLFIVSQNCRFRASKRGDWGGTYILIEECRWKNFKGCIRK